MAAVADTGFDFADLVDEAVALSGGETATASDVIRVRRGLRLLTERWKAQGYNTWRIATTTVAAPGVAALQLPECVDDVIDVTAIKAGSSTEAPMARISASQYARLTTKDTQGLPSQYWLERASPPVLHVFPVGHTGTADTLKVYYVERPEAFDRYGGDADVPGRWLNALVVGLGLHLARTRPPLDPGLIQRLTAEAADAEELAQRDDRDRGRFRYRI